jgi:hypothetical protein
MHSNLTGVGSNAEKCYIFYGNAIGHAVDKKGVQSPVGYDEEQDYSWARVSVYMGSKLLQKHRHRAGQPRRLGLRAELADVVIPDGERREPIRDPEPKNGSRLSRTCHRAALRADPLVRPG